MNDADSGRRLLSRADRDREVVQRTAELLTSSLSLEQLFHAICSLLARFVDAPIVFIALKDADGARIAFMLENGVAGRLENRRVRPESRTAEVMRTGRPILKRRLEDWTEGRLALNLPGQPQHDERVSAIFVPLKFGAEIIGVLSVQSVQPDAYAEEDVALLQTCALYLSVRIHQAQIESQTARLENMASTDSLTGVPNRRSFSERFASEWRRAIRRQSGIALLLIDIDFFKPFNDTYGHVAGDAALQQVAGALSSCLARSEDFFARYGGEEFVAILPGTDLAGAVNVAESMRRAVIDLGIAHSGSVLGQLTISAGVAFKVPARGVAAESLLEAADAALYDAKRTGRNRIVAENYRSDAPPAYPSMVYRHNLPEVARTHAGSGENARHIRRLLRGSRAVTVSGPDGIGKSFEAIAAARRELPRCRDGVFYIDLSSATADRYVATKIAAVLRVPENLLQSPSAAVAEFLRGKRALVLLDNCDDVSGGVTEAIETILHEAREVRILATCREPLLFAGEVSYTLRPLDPQSAVDLFVDRARSATGVEIAQEAMPMVDRICRQLNGLPRAIRLAAAQLQSLPLDDLAKHLPAAGTRTPHGLLAWTYGMLPPPEQALLRTLAAFTGGATIGAVAFVGEEPDADPLARRIAALADKSLVTIESEAGEKRYLVPGSIRAFAVLAARQCDEWDELARRHARYLRDRAQALEQSYPTKAWRPALERMIPELDNVRAALMYTVTSGNDPDLGAELSANLVHFWQHTGRADSGLRWIEDLLANGRTYSPALRAKLLYAMARLDTAHSRSAFDAALEAARLWRELGDESGVAAALLEAGIACSGLGDVDAAEPYLRESCGIAEQRSDTRRIAEVLNAMSVTQQWRGDTSAARPLLERSLALFRELEDDRGVASQLGNLGDLAATTGDYDLAVALTRESLAILERLHDPQSTGWQLLNLGAFELKRGNPDAARPALRRSLELLREFRDEWLSANAIDAFARFAAMECDWPRALALAGFATRVFDAIGVPRQPPDQRDYENVLSRAVSALGEDAVRKALLEAATGSWSDAVKEALAV